MARIEIDDVPQSMTLDKREMRDVLGGIDSEPILRAAALKMWTPEPEKARTLMQWLGFRSIDPEPILRPGLR